LSREKFSKINNRVTKTQCHIIVIVESVVNLSKLVFRKSIHHNNATNSYFEIWCCTCLITTSNCSITSRQSIRQRKYI